MNSHSEIDILVCVVCGEYATAAHEEGLARLQLVDVCVSLNVVSIAIKMHRLTHLRSIPSASRYSLRVKTYILL